MKSEKMTAAIHTKLTQTQLKNQTEIQTIRNIHVARSILYGIVDVLIKSSKVRLFYTFLKKTRLSRKNEASKHLYCHKKQSAE